MIQAIIIDDEARAIHTMEKLLAPHNGITIAGTFQDASLALDFATQH